MSIVTIIIPTYNRAHLISETLDSILAQTYTHWECIVVDDGSTDDSQAVFDSYANKDNRFQFLKRPQTKPKGANACRNIGLEQAIGDYIVFFDSDDLMTPDHLEVKINGIKDSGCDYVITRTKFFNHDNSKIDAYYTFDRYEITPHNYVTQKLNWLTYDICLKSELAKSISFNENLQSGQEYNYYSKLVYVSVNAKFVDKVVSLRRHHENSIRSHLKSESKLKYSYFNTNWFTYLDIKHQAEKQTRVFLMNKIARFIMDEKRFFGHSPFKIMFCVFKEIGIKSLYLPLYLSSCKLFGKGHYFRKKFSQSL